MYVPPELIQSPRLKIPPPPSFEKEEKTINYSLYTDLPPPKMRIPNLLPLPTYEEPFLQPLPSQPIIIQLEILPFPILDIIPPFGPPKLEARPCESEYYSLGDGMKGVCDGLCGNQVSHDAKDAKDVINAPCLAKSPPLLLIPPKPTNKFVLEPTFEPPPSVKSIPLFEQPNLQKEPIYVESPEPIPPPFHPPPSPPPIGYLRGSRPIFLIDCSGTMVGDRMKAVHDCMQTIFNQGGQVSI
jgi:hypothetical protein